MHQASKPRAAGCIYGYARISFLEDDSDEAARGVSIDTQRQRIQSYVAFQQACGAISDAAFGSQGWIGVREQGDETDDGFYVDRDTSAYKKPFLTRPAGRRLSAVLTPGDHIVFSRLDRAFRNVRDALTTIETWQRRGIGIHFLDPQVDLSTAHGRAFLQMSAVWAEFSSALHSERSARSPPRPAARAARSTVASPSAGSLPATPRRPSLTTKNGRSWRSLCSFANSRSCPGPRSPTPWSGAWPRRRTAQKFAAGRATASGDSAGCAVVAPIKLPRRLALSPGEDSDSSGYHTKVHRPPRSGGVLTAPPILPVSEMLRR